MLWIVQNNLYSEAGYSRLMIALNTLNIDHMVVKPVPFSDILLPSSFNSATQTVEDVAEPIIDTNQPIMVMGAITLVNIGRRRNWRPGSFLNDNFDFRVWKKHWGDHLLNTDAIVGKVHEINPGGLDWMFVRPIHDTKALSGTVMSKHDFHDWKVSVIAQDEDNFIPLHRNTEILISSTKKIYAEWRMFIVDGQIITGSQYKQGSRVIGEIPNLVIDDRVMEFTQWIVDDWQPARAFVIDIADTPDGLKVIEINNINSSGFYQADMFKLVQAIEQMVF